MHTHLPSGFPLRRRQLLALSWAALLGRTAHGAPAAQTGAAGRLVVVFLRGAVDGLSVLVPHGDPHYAQLRSSTLIAAPDGTPQSALALDARFGLHPALAPLWPLWQQGTMAAITSVGLPVPLRSHFEAQHHWETGQPEQQRALTGWLNQWAAAQGRPASTAVALGVGESNPEILRGTAEVRLVARGQAALRAGALSDERTRRALLDLYSADAELGPVFGQGSSSRMATARQLKEAGEGRMVMAGMTEQMAADNGAAPVEGLALDASHLVTLMQADPGLRIGFLSAGGWDSHANQGGVNGTLAQGLGKLAAALVVLQQGLDRLDDVIVVCSEFGRTCAENGTRGTDHGWGNTMLVMGPRIQGGRCHGRWEGLAPGQINEGRDLPVFHDFRAVFSLLLRQTQGASDAQLAAVFPGNPFAGRALLGGDNRSLASLVRA